MDGAEDGSWRVVVAAMDVIRCDRTQARRLAEPIDVAADKGVAGGYRTPATILPDSLPAKHHMDGLIAATRRLNFPLIDDRALPALHQKRCMSVIM